MKTYFILTLFVAVTSMSTIVHAGSPEQDLNRLESELIEIKSQKGPDSIEKTKSLLLKVENCYDPLKESVALYLKNPQKNASLLNAIVRLASLASQADPNGYPEEILLPIYHKQKKELEKSLKRLEPLAAKQMRESLKEASQTEKHGNG